MGLAELSGFINTLSGRADTLDTQTSYLTQDMLQRPDLVAFAAYQATVNAQLTTISDALSTVQAQLKTIQGLYTNLYITVDTNQGLFTGHTGSTTGDGVHGHT